MNLMAMLVDNMKSIYCLHDATFWELNGIAIQIRPVVLHPGIMQATASMAHLQSTLSRP